MCCTCVCFELLCSGTMASNTLRFKPSALVFVALLLQCLCRIVSPQQDCQPESEPCLPSCGPSICCFNMNEETPIGEVVGNIGVSTTLYNILSSSTEQTIGSIFEQVYFNISLETGEVSVRNRVDRENASVSECLTIGVEVTNPNALVTVGVIVMDTNDNDPNFQVDNLSVQRFETDSDPPPSRLEICRSEFPLLVASDRDGVENEITYSVEGPAGSMFRFNADSFCIESIGPIDRDDIPASNTTEIKFLNILLVATDSGGRRSNLNITIDVMDVNDNAPEFTEASLRDIRIREDEPIGKMVHIFRAVDPDFNSELTFTIIDDQDLFMINSTSGELFVKNKLDYEALNEPLDLMVTIADGPPGNPEFSTSASVSVIIEDVNEKATVNFPNENFTITENATTDRIFFIIINDEDVVLEDSFEVSLLGPYRNHFSRTIRILRPKQASVLIDLTEGIDQEALRAETQSTEFVLRVVITEVGDPSFNHSQNYTFNVSGINDNLPSLKETQFDFEEEQNPRTLVAHLEGEDKDLGINGTVVSYRLLSAIAYPSGQNLTDNFTKGDGRFQRDELGVTLEAPRIDREENIDSVIMTLKLTDGGGLSNLVTVTINIQDINDNCPEFSPQERTIKVDENNVAPLLIAKDFVATDKDIEPNKMIRYMLRTGSGNFFVNETTGEIFALTVFDREKQDRYFLQIQAINFPNNCTGATNRDTLDVTVMINDLNDKPPEFKKMNTFYVKSDVANGSHIDFVMATDGDTGSNAYSTYEIEPKDLFRIDASGGLIVFGDLTNEIGEHNLTVTATNTAPPYLSGNTTITIVVERPVNSASTSATVVITVIVIVLVVLFVGIVALVLILAYYCYCRRVTMSLSKNSDQYDDNVNSPKRGILRQVPNITLTGRTNTTSTNGSCREVKFDDKVQKIAYDDDHAVTNAVYYTESSINMGSSGDESSQTPPRPHPSVHHNGKLPSSERTHIPNGTMHHLSPVEGNYYPSHPIHSHPRPLPPYYRNEDSDANSDDDSTLPDNASSTNAPLPNVRHHNMLLQYMSSPKHGMNHMPSAQTSPPPSHITHPIGPISPTRPFAHSSSQHSDPLTPIATHHDCRISSSSSADSLTATPTCPPDSQHMMHAAAPRSGGYPAHMPTGYVAPPTSTTMGTRYVETFMETFDGSDYGASTYASAELDEALDFRPDQEPGIFSLTATSSLNSYDNEESKL